VKANIDAWWPHVEQGVEAIVITASGCGTMVADYGHLLAGDPAYAAKAARVSELAKDISVIVDAERDRLADALSEGPRRRSPSTRPAACKHGQKVRGVAEAILEDAGFELTAVADAHLCCGSAGTYSILQPELSRRLLGDKVRNLEAGAPGQIATANIGCMAHIQSGTHLTVRHWIELLDERLA
jgi:glycolate oxidase iron-sulfur subunit